MFGIFLCIVNTTDLHQAKEYGYKTHVGKNIMGGNVTYRTTESPTVTQHILLTLYLEKKNLDHWYKLNSGLNHADKFELQLCLWFSICATEKENERKFVSGHKRFSGLWHKFYTSNSHQSSKTHSFIWWKLWLRSNHVKRSNV